MTDSSGRRLSRKMSGDEIPSFLRKTVATAVRGNEARQKWKQLEERGRASGSVGLPGAAGAEVDNSPSSNSPSRPRANSVFQIMAPSQLKPRLSLAQADDQIRKNLRSLGSSTAAFEKNSAKDAIERVPLFNGCSARFLEALAPMVHSRLVEAGTDILVEGDLGDCMYILSRGDAELLKGEEVIETAEDGAVFGEYSSVSKNPALACRPWTVRATSLCDVKMLSREDVLQVLSHFRDDANMLEKRVELRITELQKMGAMPAKKEWWQIRRHSTASNYSEKTAVSKTEDSGNFRAAVGRALTGIKLARRFSVGGPAAAAVTMSPASFGSLSGGIAGVQRRRMSDSMLTANLASRLAERQNSKSSQISLQSIQERDGAQSSSSSSSSSSAAPATPSAPGSEEPVDFQASHSIRVVEAPSNAVRGETSETADEAYRGMAKGLVQNVLADFEQELESASPITVLESAGTVKFEALDDLNPIPQEASALAVTLAPSLASIERSIAQGSQDDLSPKESRDDSPSGPSMATIKLPLASRRVLSEEEHRQRNVALHPLNQGGLCGGFPVCASPRGIEMAHAAALRVCRKAPINGALSRHQQLVGQLRQNRVCKPTVASKSRSWRRTAYRWHQVDEEGGLQVAMAPPAPQSLTAIWEEFLAKKAAGII